MLGTKLTDLGINGITMRIMIENIFVRRAVCKKVSLNILRAWDTMVSSTVFQYYLLTRPMVKTQKREKITREKL